MRIRDIGVGLVNIFCLLLVILSCQKIPKPEKILNSDDNTLALEHTCESCHTNKTILAILAQDRGEAGGGG